MGHPCPDVFVQPEMPVADSEAAASAVASGRNAIAPVSGVPVDIENASAATSDIAVIKINAGRKRLTACLVITSILAIWGVSAALVLLVAAATTSAPPAQAVQFLGWFITYSSDQQGGRLLQPDVVAGLAVSASVCALLSLWHQLWLAYRIRARDQDVGLFSRRDAVSYATALVRGSFAVGLVAAWFAVVQPVHLPTEITATSQFRACQLQPVYTVVTGGGTASLQLSGNAPITPSCQSRLQFAISDLGVDESSFAGIVPDRGTLERPGGSGSVAFWQRPAGQRLGCSDAAVQAGADSAGSSWSGAEAHTPPVAVLPQFHLATQRTCRSPATADRFALSNWLTMITDRVVPLAAASGPVVSTECDPLAHSAHYATANVPLHDIEPWICGLGMQDRRNLVTVNYSVAGFTTALGTQAGCKLDGEPQFLDRLQPSRAAGSARNPSAPIGTSASSPIRFDRVFEAVSDLSDTELASLLGRDSAAVARQDCSRVAASCLNISGVVTRSVAVQGCTNTIIRTSSVDSDLSKLQLDLQNLKSAVIHATAVTCLQFAADLAALGAVRLV
jgi:hypothetical protein